jgi:hypothetical protein
MLAFELLVYGQMKSIGPAIDFQLYDIKAILKRYLKIWSAVMYRI